jgi:hypothetical protein
MVHGMTIAWSECLPESGPQGFENLPTVLEALSVLCPVITLSYGYGRSRQAIANVASDYNNSLSQGTPP